MWVCQTGNLDIIKASSFLPQEMWPSSRPVSCLHDHFVNIPNSMIDISNDSPVWGMRWPAIHLIWECRQLLDHSDGACQWHVTGLEIIEMWDPLLKKPGRMLFSFLYGPQVSYFSSYTPLGPQDSPWVVQTVLFLGCASLTFTFAVPRLRSSLGQGSSEGLSWGLKPLAKCFPSVVTFKTQIQR